MNRSLAKIAALIVPLLLVACVDNEESLFVEHAKIMPDPPDCTVSPGDAHTNVFEIDVRWANHPSTAFLLQNNLMKQEDYGKLKAESNGIIIDGYELYTLIPGVGVVGGTEYFEMNHYIPPEGSEVVFAQLMSESTIEQIQEHYDCNPFNMSTVISQIIQRADMPASLDAHTSDGLPTVMYAAVRFQGHTQGGKKLQSQEFSVELRTYCGARGGWQACYDDPCYAFCNADAIAPEGCFSGMWSSSPTCADMLASYEPYIEVQVVDASGATVTENQELCKAWCSSN